MTHTDEAKAADIENAAWTISLQRRGLEVKAGRHLHLSLSRTLLWWLASVVGAASASPYWTTLIR
ncbi:hypothetical protein ABZ471_47215 [Streptomyces sp. NPDC005728]|uniref:hypothetical protein n=1 Tax=Streptomyces sp. NPDC005728 TaxID=3157054 RepID=UPI0033DC2A71